MLNLLGFAEFALGVPGTSVRFYSKRECHKDCKVGCMNIIANSDI